MSDTPKEKKHHETVTVKLWFHKDETVFDREHSVRKGTLITRGWRYGLYNVHRWMPHSRYGAHYTIKPTDAWRKDEFVEREVEIRRLAKEKKA